ncbi:MAG: hypothetical protein NC217_07660 [Muribaculaceae bacterium]|nr:hypothetical protein [Muribaculaceae bacterium]
METYTDSILRWIFTAIGSVAALFAPALPYLLICTALIFADCFTAWCLGRRVAKTHPEHATPDTAKFKSHHFGSVILTLIKTWALLCLAFMIETHITASLPIDMTKIAAGAVCFWQLWSILENESSCNGSRWAKVLQRILVDKTSRHLNVDLSELNQDNKNENN